MNTCNEIFGKLIPENNISLQLKRNFFSGNEFQKQTFMYVIFSGQSVVNFYRFPPPSFRKSLVSVSFRPQFWGPKWLRQFYGRLAFLGSFCWKTPMTIKFLLLGGFGVSWKGGVEVPILFLWAWGFSDSCGELMHFCRVRNYCPIISKQALSCNFLR